MSERVFNVLFLCTANSARSILAEAILNPSGGHLPCLQRRQPSGGTVNPYALELLRPNWVLRDLRSKSWDEFAAPGAPDLDFVFTVCDNAAGEVCPMWPGQPMTAHWGVDDPAAVGGTDEDKRAFAAAFSAARCAHRPVLACRSASSTASRSDKLERNRQAARKRG